MSNSREKTAKEGRVSSRTVVDCEGEEGREMSEVRRYIACSSRGQGQSLKGSRESLTMSCARNSSMKDVETPVDVALKI